VKFDFIHRHRDAWEVSMMCDLLGVSRQGYYDWVGRPPSPAATRREELVGQILLCHVESRCTYGSPRVHDDLAAKQVRCCVNTVAKLMKGRGIASAVKRRFKVVTTDSKHGRPVFQNTLGRDFAADRPDRKWACDITYLPTGEGTLYLAGVVDLFSRKVVGWCMKDHLGTDLCVEALEMALARRKPAAGLLHHSDRGCQYASERYQDRLEAFSIDCSMSRVGNCYDNAAVESLWATLKTELVYQREFETKQQAADAVFEWIEVWYNRKRKHSTLGYRSPEAFEAQLN
jgi:transposase InsO family protein